jgi:phosphoribosyl 1,2-cyclic phosphate phosphodiesterase
MPDFTLTFLGTGTSMGIPVIGCSCAVCASADPRDRRSRASIHIQTPESTWVVDTGPDFRMQCLRERVHHLDAVIYTHAHTDHIMGFDDLRPFCFNARDLPVYASAETMTALQRCYQFAFNGENKWPGYIRPAPVVIEGAFTLGATEIEPLAVPHGRTSVNGYLFSRGGSRLAAYFSDCKAVPEAVIERIAGVRHLIVDALRHREHPTHMSVGEALAVVEKVRPGQAWFTHLSHELGHAATEAGLPAGVGVAYDGMKIEIQSTEASA